MSYRLLIANEVLEFLDGLRQRERLLLRARFVQIADFPENFSDFQERDSTGRSLDVRGLDLLPLPRSAAVQKSVPVVDNSYLHFTHPFEQKPTHPLHCTHLIG